jgi:hypothetical protein
VKHDISLIVDGPHNCEKQHNEIANGPKGKKKKKKQEKSEFASQQQKKKEKKKGGDGLGMSTSKGLKSLR